MTAQAAYHTTNCNDDAIVRTELELASPSTSLQIAFAGRRNDRFMLLDVNKGACTPKQPQVFLQAAGLHVICISFQHGTSQPGPLC